jgi:hypothetical protein
MMTIVVFIEVVTADLNCEEQQWEISSALCISRRIFFMLTPVFSPTASFCTVIPVLYDGRLSNLVGKVIPHLVGHNFSRLGHSLSYVPLDTHDDNNHPQTTGG